jgi:hypothetical protein
VKDGKRGKRHEKEGQGKPTEEGKDAPRDPSKESGPGSKKVLY